MDVRALPARSEPAMSRWLNPQVWLRAAGRMELRTHLAVQVVVFPVLAYGIWVEAGLSTAAAFGLLMARSLLDDFVRYYRSIGEDNG